MTSIRSRVAAVRAHRRVRRARLPWVELEAEAARQGCSPADIFFDRAGRSPETRAGGPDIQADKLEESSWLHS